ncbi:molybdenum cofactor biosynthesis protein MoaE [Paraferrimonas sp. SM1919]|uniref:molybdenum cofactor biosynthesis protein MoaE n=1 Tax=Paraferrimonas sp. SM1919 TaxID=2662263 RepID=UPI0013D7865B|nr:molybdenum cofactor biosynthesis protein MoaE [Paraferrimonas sp. SM1919]
MANKVLVEVRDVTDKQLDVAESLGFVTTNECGAEVLFVGTVRDLNQGKDVLGVSYDVFEPLAKQSFTEICQEAMQQWGPKLNLYVSHAKGRLDVGGISIVIAAASPHRVEAFAACRYVIEEIKHRSPIWKLEHYADGDSDWTQGCELCHHNHDSSKHAHNHVHKHTENNK